jgi:ATP-dependent Zn protease
MDKELRFVNSNNCTTNTKEKSINEPTIQVNQKRIDDAIERWMSEGEDATMKLVDEHWEKIEALSKVLLDKEIMYEEDLKAL